MSLNFVDMLPTVFLLPASPARFSYHFPCRTRIHPLSESQDSLQFLPKENTALDSVF